MCSYVRDVQTVRMCEDVRDVRDVRECMRCARVCDHVILLNVVEEVARVQTLQVQAQAQNLPNRAQHTLTL